MKSNGEDLGKVDVKRGILQGDSLQPLLFVLNMVPDPSQMKMTKQVFLTDFF